MGGIFKAYDVRGLYPQQLNERVARDVGLAFRHLLDDEDRAFLTAGGVFDDDMIDGYLALKRAEVQRYRAAVHPCEFDMYYSC